MGDFDLSVGAMASLAGVVAAALFVAGLVRSPAAVAVALAVGLAGGLLNGVLVSLVGILPFVATLATLTIFSGAAFMVSGGRTIFGRDIPEAFGNFARGGLQIGTIDDRALVFPNLTILALGVILARLGRAGTDDLRPPPLRHRRQCRGRAAGRRAASPWLRLTAFAFTGVGAAVAGLMYASRVASANPTQGDGLMLTAIAAVFLGMTLTRDGQPRVLATIGGRDRAGRARQRADADAGRQLRARRCWWARSSSAPWASARWAGAAASASGAVSPRRRCSCSGSPPARW